MLLKKIKLENIRSYVNEEIEFSSGTVLLSGDIGSGKSSILLALEFALFGIMKGDISGSELLRHGEKNGSVELEMEIAGRQVIIKRALKRGSAGIGQDSGYIIIDGIKTDLVAKELKARILELLGYSQEFVNKSKSLIYRYTVYTPQEEMKRIILSKPEERLDTLRNVFGIDKYKRIRENVMLYVRELKRNLSYIEGQTQDIEEINLSLKEKLETKKNLHLDIERQKPKAKKIKKVVEEKRKELESVEKEVEKTRELQNQVKIIDAKIESAKQNILDNQKRLNEEKQKILEIDKEVDGKKKVKEDVLKEKRISIENKIIESNKKTQDLNTKIGQYEFSKKEAEKLIEKIVTLTKCPTCMQKVDDNHKHEISDENKKKILDAQKRLEEVLAQKKEITEVLDQLHKKQSQFTEIQKNHEILKVKLETLNDKKKQIGEIEKNVFDLNKELESLNKQKKEKQVKPVDETKYLSLKQELSKLQEDYREEEIKLVKLIEQEKSIDDVVIGIKKQIQVKEELKKKSLKIKKTQNFLSDFFENLMISMEKHVMATIYHEFNSLVSKWFDTLIDDDTLSISLSNDFTPMLLQNGYETEIANLSGGEKTSVALSYRLALNKVINDMIGQINTKDLIILDEPTDGFSTEQLDRVRDVIDELELNQVIIVSHEPKIESFVNNIIRIEKEGHGSRVVG
ncbi:AAA family ATPase [Candidatus Woesearchaeota archaeon]|nr:AAA family ATPase [Candidatus Woesearchaeota archaeon]